MQRFGKCSVYGMIGFILIRQIKCHRSISGKYRFNSGLIFQKKVVFAMQRFKFTDKRNMDKSKGLKGEIGNTTLRHRLTF